MLKAGEGGREEGKEDQNVGSQGSRHTEPFPAKSAGNLAPL